MGRPAFDRSTLSRALYSSDASLYRVVPEAVFVPGDLIKCVLCALVVHTVAKALPDWPFGGRAR